MGDNGKENGHYYNMGLQTEAQGFRFVTGIVDVPGISGLGSQDI